MLIGDHLWIYYDSCILSTIMYIIYSISMETGGWHWTTGRCAVREKTSSTSSTALRVRGVRCTWWSPRVSSPVYTTTTTTTTTTTHSLNRVRSAHSLMQHTHTHTHRHTHAIQTAWPSFPLSLSPLLEWRTRQFRYFLLGVADVVKEFILIDWQATTTLIESSINLKRIERVVSSPVCQHKMNMCHDQN